MGVEARWLHDEGVTLYGSVLPGLYARWGQITYMYMFVWVVNGEMRRIRACCSEILRLMFTAWSWRLRPREFRMYLYF